MRRIVVDCAHLDFCDSSGLSALLMAQRRAEAAGASMLLTRLSDALDRLLDVTGTTAVFEVDDARGEVANALGGQNPVGSARAYPAEGCWIVRLSGEIDLDVAAEVEAALHAAIAVGGPIVVDLSRVQFADSTMLHLLLRARDKASLYLAGPLSEGLRTLFDVTDVSTVFRLYPNLDDAAREAGLPS